LIIGLLSFFWGDLVVQVVRGEMRVAFLKKSLAKNFKQGFIKDIVSAIPTAQTDE